jgi:hypothetical protein
VIGFLEFAGLVFIGATVLFAVLGWIKDRHPGWRNVAAIVVAAGAAYSASFALDMCIGAFTWSGIAIILHLFARSVSARRVWIGTPYLFFGALAVTPGLVGPHKLDIAVGVPLILFGILSILIERTRTPTTASRSAQP